MKTVTKGDSIRSLVPGSKFIISGDIIDWKCDLEQPTSEEIDSEIVRLTEVMSEKMQRDTICQELQNHLDSQARELRYDNILSCRSYAWYENEYQSEALWLSQWSSQCWSTLETIERDIKENKREVTSIEEILKELPQYTV